MSTAVSCDNAGCTTWATAEMAEPAGFLHVTWGGHAYDLCSPDCLLEILSHVEPMASR